jgi:aromatic ring-opening dioxygenase catalytic subunit (LigB family)
MVHTGAHPELLFDYYGFPAETYQLKYPGSSPFNVICLNDRSIAPGSPEIARKAISLLQSSGIPAEEESSRGWDHGVFVPLKLIFAEADVPVVEMSILSSLDPAEHVRIGRALAPLRQQGSLASSFAVLL